MPKNPPYKTFHFGRPLAEAPGSLSPHAIYRFVDSASGMLVPRAPTLDLGAPNILTPMSTLEFSVIPSRLVRVARSHARGSRQGMSNDEVKAALYDQMPPSKTKQAIGRVVGAGVVGKADMFVLELESKTLENERDAAIDALREIFELSDAVDLNPSSYKEVPLGRFAGGVDDEIAVALGSATESLAKDKVLTFMPIPNPHET